DYTVATMADVRLMDVYFVANRILPLIQSAHAEWAKSESPVRLRRLRMRFITRPENAYAICQSRPTSCSISHEGTARDHPFLGKAKGSAAGTPVKLHVTRRNMF